MIDISKLLKYLFANIWWIILIPLCVGITTFFLSKDLPEEYVSQSKISTGLSEQLRLGTASGLDYGQIRQIYANIIGMMKMKRVIDRVSYKLVLHDLENHDVAFRPHGELIGGLSAEQKKGIIDQIKSKLAVNNLGYRNLDSVGGIALSDIIASMGYNEENLVKLLEVERADESDFINVEFTSENPELSAFVVNNLSSEFIHYYHLYTARSETKSVQLLDSLLKEKERVMNQKRGELNNYRLNYSVLSAGKQYDVLYQQVSGLENRRIEKIAEIESLEGAIRDINSKLNDPNDADLQSNVSALNNKLLVLDNQLHAANKQYIDNNFQPEDKKVVDSLQRIRRTIVSSSSSNTGAVNPRETRQNLLNERIRLETNLSLTRNSMDAIERELTLARNRFNAMVPTDAGLQNYEREVELATGEYLDALNRYNETGLASNTAYRLNIIEYGVSGAAKTSKRVLIVGMSAFASLLICLTTLVVLFLLDRRVMTQVQLEQATQSKVIGTLNFIDTKYGLRSIWNDKGIVHEYSLYKDLLRSLRFDITESFLNNGKKVLGITSLNSHEGKSFLSQSLAYGFALTGKRVLLISNDAAEIFDGGSANENDTKAQHFETFLIKREIRTEDLITVLRWNVETTSIMELKEAKNLNTGFDILRREFDIIIIDIESCLSNINRVKEWLLFTDFSLAVFEAGLSIPDNGRDAIKYLREHEGFFGWVLNKAKNYRPIKA